MCGTAPVSLRSVPSICHLAAASTWSCDCSTFNCHPVLLAGNCYASFTWLLEVLDESTAATQSIVQKFLHFSFCARSSTDSLARTPPELSQRHSTKRTASLFRSTSHGPLFDNYSRGRRVGVLHAREAWRCTS
ncbi:hypothetical protein TRVL_07610 [Trypanosoma vivax]|nr:hypothetical protein TRVL_07610 [Trypanosoma vivax]